jgi:hypothetical protein
MTIGRRLLAEPTPPTKLIQQPDRTFRKRRSLLIAALAAAFGAHRRGGHHHGRDPRPG